MPRHGEISSVVTAECSASSLCENRFINTATTLAYDFSFYRVMLCIRGTSHGPVSICPSVRPSVCPSQVGVLLKGLNVGSHKQHHTIAQGSSFLKPKISAKFDQGHPLRGRHMQVGWVKIGDFPQITCYISKTVQDRRMVSIKVE